MIADIHAATRAARAYAAALGVSPRRLGWGGRPRWKWDAPGAQDDDAHALPALLWASTPFKLGRPYPTEEACYAVLAHALDFLTDRR